MTAPSDALILDAVKQAIYDLTVRGHASSTVMDETYTYLDLDKLIRLRDDLERRVAAATRAAAGTRRAAVGSFQRLT
jgi:hypothetical protein